MSKDLIPKNSYGVNKQDSSEGYLAGIVEGVLRNGYAIFEPNFDLSEISLISKKFDEISNRYVEVFGESNLREIDELNTIRAPIAFEDDGFFMRMATSEKLTELVRLLIGGKFILNQQNAIINPAMGEYNQGYWHRDIPYQHFTCSKPLAINALYCVDDFTELNGGTFVLPASHLRENLPSSEFIKNNAVQISAKAGSFIILDCMTYHAGGSNISKFPRRAINHVYTIPFFKQQVNFSGMKNKDLLTTKERELLGINDLEAMSIEAYLKKRKMLLTSRNK